MIEKMSSGFLQKLIGIDLVWPSKSPYFKGHGAKWKPIWVAIYEQMYLSAYLSPFLRYMANQPCNHGNIFLLSFKLELASFSLHTN